MTERIHRFANGELSFDVTDAGPLDGEIVVLLHGFPQTSRAWDAVCPQLHRRGYRTLVFDQRGYAPGARPRGRFAYRMGALVSDVVALINTAGGKPVHVVGHDWGSAVSWGLAARFPELVRTLTAVSVAHPRAFLLSLLSSAQIFRSYYMALFQIPWLAEALFRYSLKHARRNLRAFGITKEQAQQMQTDIVDGGALTGGLNWYRAMLFAGPAYAKKVRVPTTHVWSSGDAALSRRGATLCKRFVTGPYRLEILDGTHWIPEQQPERLSEIILERVGEAQAS